LEKGNIRVWVASGTKQGESYVALFNLGESVETAKVAWSEIGIPASAIDVRDLWNRKSLGAQSNIQVELRAHASAMYRVTATD
jgi:alpha-galactosidase